MGYPYSLGAVSAIVVSALLGVLVSLSTFLVIGATSSLTYNVTGHSKTVRGPRPDQSRRRRQAVALQRREQPARHVLAHTC
jgi:hypothetical protein